jgi:hypothetical protein
VTDDHIDRLLADFLDDVPAMTPHAHAAGRARLLATVGVAPAPATPVEEVAVIHALPTQPLRRSPPLRRAAPWLAAVTGVAAVAIGVVAVAPGTGAPSGSAPQQVASSQPSTAPAPVTGPLPALPAAPLNGAADLAAKSSDLKIPAGQVLHWQESRTDKASGRTESLDVWVQHDPRSPWVARTSNGDLESISAAGFEEKRPACTRDATGMTCPDPGPWAATPNNVATMSRDPKVLYDKLRAIVNAGPPAGATIAVTPAQDATNKLLTLIDDQLTVPADLRAALLRTLGYLPGITITANVTSTDGRPAVAIGWEVDNGNYRNELLLEPDTARPIEWRNVAIKAFNGHPAGQPFSSAIQTQSIVHELGAN